MANALVIVESPAKAKTIEKFLGKGYKVLASYGHVRALPSKQGSVDVEHGFAPLYHILPESKKQVDILKKEVKTCDELILATDPDREGEGIAWHLLQALGIDENGTSPKVRRVVFHEITKGAIQKAMAEPRHIARDLVDAQQARAILDYLVGFTLSPFLWKKIRYGLSAGRVQSVALRLICDREKEIGLFETREYWTIEAALKTSEGKEFSARLTVVDGEKLDKFAIAGEKEAHDLTTAIAQNSFEVETVSSSEKRRNPAPPSRQVPSSRKRAASSAFRHARP